MRISGYDIIGEQVRKYREYLDVLYDRFIVQILADGIVINDYVEFEENGDIIFDMDWDEGQDDFRLIKIVPLAELWKEERQVKVMKISSSEDQNCGQCANCGNYYIEWNDRGHYYDVCGKCFEHGNSVYLSDSCSDYEEVVEDDH